MKLLLITLTILQSLLATLEQKTLQSEFTITITDGQPIAPSSQPMTYSGTLAMRGKQFTINMLSLEAAYDGTTLYMYSEEAEELTLSTPTEEELTQTNPFLYAKALLPVCKHTEKESGDKTIITLVPKNPHDDISKFILRVTTTTLIPVSLEIHEAAGNITNLRLNKAEFSDTTPEFTIEKEEAFVNDLR